jgi:hypothetical protein
VDLGDREAIGQEAGRLQFRSIVTAFGSWLARAGGIAAAGDHARGGHDEEQSGEAEADQCSSNHGEPPFGPGCRPRGGWRVGAIEIGWRPLKKRQDPVMDPARSAP